jgi:hypothetical protein
MSDNLLSRSQQQTMEINLIPTVQQSNRIPQTLPPLIEPIEIQCQWSGCDLLFSTPIQLTEVQILSKIFLILYLFFL